MELDLKALKSGDERAFEQFVLQYEKKIYNIALKYTSSESAACDISQEVFLKIYKSISTFKELSSLSTWVYRITYNVCIDYLRREKRMSEVSLFVDGADDEDYLMELPDTSSSPELVMDKTILREVISSSIEKLSAEHRSMIILRDLQGLSYAQIAKITGCEEGTVKSRINRAREKLRTILRSDGNFSEYSQSKLLEEVAEGALQ